MPFNWPFSKSYGVKCPDGTIKTVYKNVDHAFPLFIPGWKGDVRADIKAVEQVTANIGAAYESKIQGLLFSLDDRNQSLMMTFRTVYVAYASDPCSRSGFFERQLERLLDDQNRLSVLKVKIQALIELARNHPDRDNQIFALFQSIVDQLGGRSVSEAAAIEILETRAIAQKWIGSDENDR